MNDSNQISLSGLFWGVVTASLLVAAVTTQSGFVLFVSITLLCFFAGCYCSIKKFRPWYAGAVVGYLLPALLILNVLVSTVVKAEIVQGKLYHESGPGFFVFNCAIVFIISGGICALLFAFVWTILVSVSKRSWDKYEA